MNFGVAKELVFSQKPMLRKIYEEQGGVSLYDYGKKSLSIHVDPPDERKDELQECYFEDLQKVFGQKIASGAIEQLNKSYYVSTADHHQFITHPFSINGFFVQSHINRENDLNNILVLSCAGISLNNSSFPRGLIFHNSELEEFRLHFLSLRNRHQPVFVSDPFLNNDLQRLRRDVGKMVQNRKLTENEGEILMEFLEDIYGNEEVLGSSDLAEQVAKVNFKKWKRLPGQENVNLLFLDQESLVKSLILRHQLHKKTLINELIFNPRYLKSFEKIFDGIQGAFSKNKGTFLFWAIKDKKRIPLSLKGNKLVNETAGVSIDLDVENIERGLKTKSLMPGMALSFIVLSFYYGLTCGGGFSQVNYLFDMKNAWKRLLKEVGEKEDPWLQDLETSHLSADYSLIFLANKRKISPAFSLDFILHPEAVESIEVLSKKVTVKEALDNMMPEFYRIVSGEAAIFNTTNISPVLYV